MTTKIWTSDLNYNPRNYGGGPYIAVEASDVGLGPGSWPESVTLADNIGDERYDRYDRIRPVIRRQQLCGFAYRCADPHLTRYHVLIIWND